MKKLILLILVALLVIPATIGCSSEQPIQIQPAVAATTSTNAATEIPLSVPEFGRKVENGEFRKGDAVLIVGIVSYPCLNYEPVDKDGGIADYLMLVDPDTYPNASPPHIRVWISETRVKVGEQIVIRGEYSSYSNGIVTIHKAKRVR